MDHLLLPGEVWVGVLATRTKCGLSGNQRPDSHPSLEQDPTSPCICGPDSRESDGQVPQTHPRTQLFSSLPLQDKQNEASYLRDHKEELTEELATTILQKVGGPGAL